MLVIPEDMCNSEHPNSVYVLTTIDQPHTAPLLVVSPCRGILKPQEWDGASGISEQQLISISSAVSGTFRLALDGATTASIPYNAPASRIASALAALPNVAAPVDVTKESEATTAIASSSVSTVSTWRVAFVSNVGDLSLMDVQARLWC